MSGSTAPETTKQKHKLKIQLIDPVKDMADIWRLFKSSIVNEPWDYPSLRETHEDDVRAHLIRYTIQNPGFMGIMVRNGKRPVGQIIGQTILRDCGDPKHFFFIYNFWVEPDMRKQGVAKDMWPAFMEELRKRGIFNWEAHCDEKLKNFLTEYKGYETRIISYRIGGRV